MKKQIIIRLNSAHVIFSIALWLALWVPCKAQWTILDDDLPMPLGAIDPAVVNGSIYVFGGKITSVISSDTVWIYNPESGWFYGGKLPDSLEAIVTEEFNGKAYLFGGHSHPDFVYRTEVMVYDPATQKFDTVGNMPTAKSWFTSVVLNGKIYLMGGDDGTPGGSKSVDIFDPITGNWTTGPSTISGRAGASADTMDGKIYLTGGGAGTAAFTTMEIYDPANPGWVMSPVQMHYPRAFHSCKNVGGKLYNMGGVVSFSEPYQNRVEYYDPVLAEWVDFDPMNIAKREFGGAVLNGDLYAIGGASSDLGSPSFISKVEIYDFVSASQEAFSPNAFDPKLNIIPNPSAGHTTILYQLAQASKVNLKITDMNGLMVQSLSNEWQSAGEHIAIFNGKDLPKGVYWVVLELGSNQRFNTRLVIQ